MRLPKHIAIVMDGNGRWAKQRNLPRIAGHEQGMQSVKKVIDWCANKGVSILSLFAFGIDNWQRPKFEVDFLMKLFARTLLNETEELSKKNIQLRIIGDLERLTPELRNLITDAVNMTAGNNKLILVLAISYSGRWDITQAMKKIARRIEKGEIKSSDVTQQLVAKELMLADLPEPDLFIRTSGEHRISNFFLWQLSYSEFYFSNTYWPDFSEGELDKALACYQTRERRFGKISEQLVEA